MKFVYKTVESVFKSLVKIYGLYTLTTTYQPNLAVRLFFINTLTTTYQQKLFVYQHIRTVAFHLFSLLFYSFSPSPINKTNKGFII